MDEISENSPEIPLVPDSLPAENSEQNPEQSPEVSPDNPGDSSGNPADSGENPAQSAPQSSGEIPSELLDEMRGFLKIDLGISTNIYDERLNAYLRFAAIAIKSEGADLDFSDSADRELCIMFAAWRWRRRDSGEGMPRMVRYALNNRIFSEKMKSTAPEIPEESDPDPEEIPDESTSGEGGESENG